MIKVFDDISHFQIGLLKPPKDAEDGQLLSSFVPVFPFLYEKLEGGDIIQDRDSYISLHVNPVNHKQVK